jgi:TolA-binding protein
MAKRITRKQMKHDEFVEATFDFAHWLEEHWAKVALWVGLVVLTVLAVVSWQAWAQRKAGQAMDLLAQGIDRYEQAESDGFTDSTGLASLLETFDRVSRSAPDGAGQVARFYRGATLFRLERLDEARSELQQVVAESGPSVTVGATARVLLAQVEVAAGRIDEAVSVLRGLADDPAAVIPAPQALLELGRVQSRAGRTEQARAQWQRILDEYPESLAATEARSLLQ